MQSSLENKRHSLAHVLAGAVTKLYPRALFTIGPAVENGFYYDIDFGNNAPKEEDFENIQNEMKKVVKSWSSQEKSFVQQKVTESEAKEIFKNNPYKLELIQGIVDRGEEITLYVSGKGTEYEFIDLCRGGHVENTSEISDQSFMLDKIAGAYWRGDEKNKMLVRIYGLAFDTKEELELFVRSREEAKKRDHRKLGKELKLFTISDLVGSGLPLFQPKGTILRQELEKFLWSLHKGKGYQRVWTPHLAKAQLYEVSGHGQHYLDDMFSVHGGTSKEDFYLKPMNCPHHYQIFLDNQFSYRDMPIKYFEPATIYRDEKTGQLSGLARVRAITQDDGHLFCRASQVKEEVDIIVDIIKQFYTTMNMIDGYWVRLSTRGDDKTGYLGSDEIWNTAESALKEICDSNNLPYKEGKNEAAFYGPKLDFMFKDAIGREWQLATVQLDFNAPERFDLSFVNEKGENERPVVIHRAISGSIERFLGVAIEHFAGAFPLWLSPVQLKVIPIGERQLDFAHDLFKKISQTDIRVEIDQSSEGLGKKVRSAKVEKTPYILVVGDKEMESNTFSLEGRVDEKVIGLSLDEVVKFLEEKIKSKAL
jgi:threonyl-tRNA synthetase